MFFYMPIFPFIYKENYFYFFTLFLHFKKEITSFIENDLYRGGQMNNNNNNKLNKEFKNIINSIKKEIKTTQIKIAVETNKSIINLYFKIGKILNDNFKYGNKFIDFISQELKNEFPNTKGFSVRNLKYMKKFYHGGGGPARELIAIDGGGRGGQSDDVLDVGGVAADGGAQGLVGHGVLGLDREDDLDGAVAGGVDGDDVAVDGNRGGAGGHLGVGDVVAALRAGGDLVAVDGNGAVAGVVGDGGHGVAGVVGVGLDAEVAVAGHVGPGAVGFLVVGGVAMVGMGPLAPGDLGGGVIGDVDVLAVVGVGAGRAQGEDHGKAVAGGQGDGRIQGDGIVAGILEVAVLGAHQRAGAGIAAAGVLIDLHGVGGGLVPGGDGDRLQALGAVGREDVGNLAVVAHGLIVGNVAGAVVLVAVGVIVQIADLVEEAGVVQRGAVLIGEVEVAALAPGAAPGVLDDPGAVGAGAVGGLEVGLGVVVVPAHDGDGVVAVLVAAGAVGGGLLEAVGGGAGVEIGVGVVIADGGRAVLHDGFLDGVAVGRGNPGDVGHVGDVIVVGVLRIQAGGRGVAVLQRGGRLRGGTCPAHHSEGGHRAVAALIEVGVAQRLGGVAGQHAQLVVSVGVVEPGKMQLGEVHAAGGGRAGIVVDDAVLDHVGFDGGHGAEGPAGTVGILVLDSGDVAVAAAVVAAGEGRSDRVGRVGAVRFPAQISVGQRPAAVIIHGNVAVEGPGRFKLGFRGA